MSSKQKAPSLIIDPTVLGDRLPRDRDSIAQMKEKIRKGREQFKLPNQSFLENTDMALGGPMDPRDFIRRLLKMEPKLLIEPGGYSDCVRVGIPTIDDDPLSPTHGTLVPTWLSCGFLVDRRLPEFSSVITDNEGVAKREIRGWRTVLLRLIHVGAITYQQAKKEFGEPTGQRGSLWMQQMREHRA
jgi:hypothetical protein